MYKSDKLNPMIIKLAIIGKISYESKDYGTNRNCYQIISSLQKQRNYYRMCRDTLEKAAINKNYYIIIKSNLNRGVVYKLCDKYTEFKSLNKEFNDCFSSIKKHQIYLHTPLESTNNLIAFYLECLSAIKSEGISMQQAFKDCPAIEKYYRECLHSDLKAFVKMIGYKAENTSNLYRAVKKIKENT